MDAQLVEIVNRGGHAQSAEAAKLLVALASDPGDAEAATMARALIEAYLHDPDLVR